MYDVNTPTVATSAPRLMPRPDWIPVPFRRPHPLELLLRAASFAYTIAITVHTILGLLYGLGPLPWWLTLPFFLLSLLQPGSRQCLTPPAAAVCVNINCGTNPLVCETEGPAWRVIKKAGQISLIRIQTRHD